MEKCIKIDLSLVHQANKTKNKIIEKTIQSMDN